MYGKTLGIHLNTQIDSFHVSAATMEDATPTKRTVASAAARLFDVMGWFGPVSLYIKIYMQRLWLLQLGWDEPIPNEHLPPWQA